MRNLYYTIDKALWKMAHVQLAKYYNMPCSAECGGTLTYRYDQQNGAEGMLFMLAAYSSGAQLLVGIGSCYNAIGMSAEMMLIQTAWLETAKFLAQGFPVDELHLGLQNIKKAGPQGNFLMDDLTLKFMRGGEFFSNDLFDFSSYCGESSSLLEKAHQKVEELVADYVSSVPGQIQEELRRYFHDCYIKKE
jgi:trimethylamine--corrinoid protein Co-methyltransferase